jgi:hypothetical protein
MVCSRCKSSRVLYITIKATDAGGSFDIDGKEENIEGYIPNDLGIGGGDYVEFKYCLDCGQMQGKFPLKEIELEVAKEETIEEDINPMELSEEDYEKYKEGHGL